MSSRAHAEAIAECRHRRPSGRPPQRADYHGKAFRPSYSRPFSLAMAAAAFGERLRAVRQEYDVSADELAAALDMADTTVANWERGIKCPHLGDVFRIAVAIGCSLDALLGGLDE